MSTAESSTGSITPLSPQLHSFVFFCQHYPSQFANLLADAQELNAQYLTLISRSIDGDPEILNAELHRMDDTFRLSWAAFLDSLAKEWRIINIVSATIMA
jgi:hypothetical protein